MIEGEKDAVGGDCAIQKERDALLHVGRRIFGISLSDFSTYTLLFQLNHSYYFITMSQAKQCLAPKSRP